MYDLLTVLSIVTTGTCQLCLSEPWDSELGVQNYPRKPSKKASRVERTLVCVLEREGTGDEKEYLLTQRPSKGIPPCSSNMLCPLLFHISLPSVYLKDMRS